MSETVLVAIITGACAVAGNLIISAKNTKELFAQLDKRSELSDSEIKKEMAVFKAEVSGEISKMKAEITELRKSVDKHNSVVERTYKLEKEQAVQKEQIKVANNRIADLEAAK